MNSVVMRENYKMLPKMVDFGGKYKLDRVSFVFLNDKNRRDIDEIDDKYLKSLTVKYVETVEDVLQEALLKEKVKNPIEFVIPEERK